MNIKKPDILSIIKNISEIESSFDHEKKKIGEWMKWQIQGIKENKEKSDIEIYKIFLGPLLIRFMKGEAGDKIIRQIDKRINSFEDITEETAKKIVEESNYRWKNAGIHVILKSKDIIKTHYGSWKNYFNLAEEDYKSNFPNDEFRKIKFVGYKLRDLGLKEFSSKYLAIDLHLTRFLPRTGLFLYAYDLKDKNIGTNPSDGNQYLFLHKLYLYLAEKGRIEPAEFDTMVWHFGRTICKAKPLCESCPIKDECLSYG